MSYQLELRLQMSRIFDRNGLISSLRRTQEVHAIQLEAQRSPKKRSKIALIALFIAQNCHAGLPRIF
jgi:hypothetical protein